MHLKVHLVALWCGLKFCAHSDLERFHWITPNQSPSFPRCRKASDKHKTSKFNKKQNKTFTQPDSYCSWCPFLSGQEIRPGHPPNECMNKWMNERKEKKQEGVKRHLPAHTAERSSPRAQRHLRRNLHGGGERPLLLSVPPISTMFISWAEHANTST